MPTRRKSVRKVRPIENVLKDPRPIVYANNTSIMITPWDFALQFGRVIEATKERLRVQEEICVYMSPQHAKSFRRLLEKLVSVYEETYGTIPEPEGTKDPVAIA